MYVFRKYLLSERGKVKQQSSFKQLTHYLRVFYTKAGKRLC